MELTVVKLVHRQTGGRLLHIRRWVCTWCRTLGNEKIKLWAEVLTAYRQLLRELRIEEAKQFRNLMCISSVDVQSAFSEYTEPYCGQEEDRNAATVLVTFRFLSTST